MLLLFGPLLYLYTQSVLYCDFRLTWRKGWHFVPFAVLFVMQQLGQKNADLLLLPSGDWFAISNFHAHMAVYRGIENGCSVFREVSNGLSVATDYRGKVAGSRDWFRDGRSLWMVELPVGHVDTIYDRIGDVLPYGCLLYVLFSIVVLLTVRSRLTAAPLATDRMALQP